MEVGSKSTHQLAKKRENTHESHGVGQGHKKFRSGRNAQ